MLSGYLFVIGAVLIAFLAGWGFHSLMKKIEKSREEETMYYED